MIELYSGTPGSGKSLHIAREIRSRLRTHKRYIIGNFFINMKAIKKCKGQYIMVNNNRLEPERLLQFSRRLSRHLGRRLKEGEIFLVIDEAQLHFNPRSWQDIENRGWLSFFSQHRHYGYDIVLIAQRDRMLARSVRDLLEYESIHRKVSRFGNIGFFVGLFTKGNLYIVVKKWYPIKEKVDSEMFVGTKRIFDIYDSFNHFDAPGQNKRVSGDLRGPANKLVLSAPKNAVEDNVEPAEQYTVPVIEIKAPEPGAGDDVAVCS